MGGKIFSFIVAAAFFILSVVAIGAILSIQDNYRTIPEILSIYTIGEAIALFYSYTIYRGFEEDRNKRANKEE